uniref:Chondroadherin-like protein n=1 Tax=Ornithorhynchus anatinus TaxID=9258 RepID=A0A6I8PHH6_ORNAN
LTGPRPPLQPLAGMRLSLRPVLALALAMAWGAASDPCPRICLCDNARRHVACRQQNLTRVPDSVPQVTQRLNLQGNTLKVIGRETFLPLPYLTHLDLRHCQVEHLEEGAFRGLGRLLYLNLASNHLPVLLQEALDGLGSLRQLVLEGNRLEEIRPGAFGQLGSLGALSLAHNALVYLPDMAFQGLVRARRLRLSHNAINVLAPEALGGLPGLRRLSLDHNELQALPGEALSRPGGLARLDLSHNPLTYVGEEDALALPALRDLALAQLALQEVGASAFARCPRLRSLDLGGNQLAALPPLEGLGRLRRLNLTGNPLRCTCAARPLREWARRARLRVDGTCAGPRRLRGEALHALRATDLRCADPAPQPVPLAGGRRRRPAVPRACSCSAASQHSSCAGRGLEAVPRGFPDRTRLLDLRRNRLGSVAVGAFHGLGLLVSLHLQDCRLERLEPGALAGLTQLVYLYLSDNRLSGLSAAALRGAPRLGYLYLDRNRFTRVPAAALAALPGLFALHLQHNFLGRLEAGDLARAAQLRQLYLSGNRVSRVAEGALSPARELERLRLDGNRLRKVPTEALRGLPALGELDLAGNPLRVLPDGAFGPLAGSLRHLYLNATGLDRISPRAFSGLELSLQTLYLDRNRLRALPALDGFTRLELVSLSDNPFHCDCRLLPLHRWLAGLNLQVGATCQSPARARGQRVKTAAAIFEPCSGQGSRKTKPSHPGSSQDSPARPRWHNGGSVGQWQGWKGGEGPK